jgi:hypothetical protein
VTSLSSTERRIQQSPSGCSLDLLVSLRAPLAAFCGRLCKLLYLQEAARFRMVTADGTAVLLVLHALFSDAIFPFLLPSTTYLNCLRERPMMRLEEYLLWLVKACNPNQYEKLLEHRQREFLQFFLYTLVLSVFVFTIISIPLGLSAISDLEARASRIDKLELSADVQAAEPITLTDRPQIVLDLSENATRSGTITLTNEGLLYPKYFLFGTETVRWSDIRDLRQNTPSRDSALFIAVLFLLPSIIFWGFLVSFGFILLLFLILAIAGWAAPRALNHHIAFGDVMKLVVITLPAALLLSLALLPLGATILFWGGILFSVILFIIGIAMLSELRLVSHEGKKTR